MKAEPIHAQNALVPMMREIAAAMIPEGASLEVAKVSRPMDTANSVTAVAHKAPSAAK
jgi:hypothetical protein